VLVPTEAGKKPSCDSCCGLFGRKVPPPADKGEPAGASPPAPQAQGASQPTVTETRGSGGFSGAQRVGADVDNDEPDEEPKVDAPPDAAAVSYVDQPQKSARSSRSQPPLEPEKKGWNDEKEKRFQEMRERLKIQKRERSDHQVQWPPREGHAVVVTRYPKEDPGSKHASGEMVEEVVLMGGVTTKMVNDVWSSWDMGSTWACVTENAEWEPRCDFQCVFVANAVPSMLLLFGGNSDRSMDLSDVWSCTDRHGLHWVKVTPKAPWPPRNSHSACVAADGVTIVLVGGWSDGHRLGDVWVCKDKRGALWSQVDIEPAVSTRMARAEAQLVLTSVGELLLLGGINEMKVSGLLNDVWRSTDCGETWHDVPTTTVEVTSDNHRDNILLGVSHQTKIVTEEKRSGHFVIPAGSEVVDARKVEEIAQQAPALSRLIPDAAPREVQHYQVQGIGEMLQLPAPLTLSVIPPASTKFPARRGHCAIGLDDGSVVVCGGWVAGTKSANDVWRSRGTVGGARHRLTLELDNVNWEEVSNKEVFNLWGREAQEFVAEILAESAIRQEIAAAEQARIATMTVNDPVSALIAQYPKKYQKAVEERKKLLQTPGYHGGALTAKLAPGSAKGRMLIYVEVSGSDVWKNAEVIDAQLRGLADRFAQRMDEVATRKEILDPATGRSASRQERSRRGNEAARKDWTFIRLEPDSRFSGVAASEDTIMAAASSGVEWELLATSSTWQPRELHRVVAVRKKTKHGYIKRLLLLGGRDAREQPLGDVWYSDDGGQSWQEVVPSIPKPKPAQDPSQAAPAQIEDR